MARNMRHHYVSAGPMAWNMRHVIVSQQSLMARNMRHAIMSQQVGWPGI